MGFLFANNVLTICGASVELGYGYRALRRSSNIEIGTLNVPILLSYEQYLRNIFLPMTNYGLVQAVNLIEWVGKANNVADGTDK